MTYIREMLCFSLVIGSALTGCIDERSAEREGREEEPGGSLSVSNGETDTDSAGEEVRDVGGERGGVSGAGDESNDRNTSGADSAGGEAGATDTTSSGDDQSDRPGREAGDEMGGETSGGEIANDEAGERLSGEEAPPVNDRGPGCQAYCDQLATCFVPACPGSELFFNDEVCDQWCGEAPDAQLGAFAALECDDFNNIIITSSEDLAYFCSDEGIPSGCEEICEDFNECGFPIETQGCLRVCRGYEEPMYQCAVSAQTCLELFDCVDGMEPEDQINYQEACEGKCFREFVCIREVCADGTLELDDAFEDGYYEACTQECVEERPALEELSAVSEGMCVELIQSIRAEHPEIDLRCDNAEDEVCALLCEKVSACGEVTLDECRAACPDWDVSNRRCIDNTTRDDCEQLNGCVGDPSGQARCRRICDHLQGCLLEACPPQIISPSYSDDCTAGCLPQPPSARLSDEYVAYSCAEIRAGLYQDNPSLRPICDGGQDFRPTAEECIDVCQTSLDMCTPGGELQCTALCRSLTREEYTCVLSDGSSCDTIDACLPQ